MPGDTSYISRRTFLKGIGVLTLVLAAPTLSSCGKLSFLNAASSNSKIDVSTYHYNNLRDGANKSEVTLTPGNVNATSFGKLFSVQVDGDVYAQSLYKSNLKMPDGGVRDVLFVATAHDSLYALDCSNGQILWQDSFIDPANGIIPVPAADTNADDIVPEIGIIGTPVIDVATETLYVVSKVKNTSFSPPTYAQYLHAIDLATGQEKFNGPTLIAFTVQDLFGDNISFDPLLNNQRAALTLEQDAVYICWASHGDYGDYHGWIISYDAHDISQVLSGLVTTPNGAQGSIWMSGGGLSSDGTYLYAAVGNGTFSPQTQGYGDSALKLTPDLQIVDSFTPYNQQDLSINDYDFGSAEPLLLPGSDGSPAYLLTADKLGNIYVINLNDMGGLSSPSSPDIYDMGLSPILNNMAFYGGRVYIGANNMPLQAFKFYGGTLTQTPDSITSNVFGHDPTTYNGLGTNPVVSANGDVDGVVWALDNSGFANRQPAVLHAYDATNLSLELFDSSLQGGRDQAGPAVKFTSPLVADGKVFVPGGSVVTVYGLK